MPAVHVGMKIALLHLRGQLLSPKLSIRFCWRRRRWCRGWSGDCGRGGWELGRADRGAVNVTAGVCVTSWAEVFLVIRGQRYDGLL